MTVLARVSMGFAVMVATLFTFSALVWSAPI